MNTWTRLPRTGTYDKVNIVLESGQSFEIQDADGVILFRYVYGSGIAEIKQELIEHYDVMDIQIRVFA